MATVNSLNFIAPTLTFSPLRISTITTTAQLGTVIHLDALFNQIRIMPYWDLNDGVLKMEFKGTTKGTSFKDIMLKQKEVKKSFFNQATLVVRREISPLNWKEINVKLFRNGGVQMTGVRSIDMSGDTIRWLIEHINTTCDSAPVFAQAPAITKEEIQLINTDFSIGAKVRRDVLHRILSETYNLNSSYESAIYQGVKTKFFYNAQRQPSTSPGVCGCPRLCKGTGDGSKIGECKKITISPFQTGQVIITGARAMEQIEEAYVFIKNVFTDNADEILRKVYVLPPDTTAPTAPAAPTTKEKPAKQVAGWIQHPCPRNIVRKITK
jgi:TATA-box binding protein (TBP) (component of TFIID and TFIIIB)